MRRKRHRAFGDRDPFHPPHFLVGRKQQVDLPLDGDAERILQKGILPGIDVALLRREDHIFALGERGGLGDRHRFGGASLHAFAGKPVGRGKTPRAAGDHPDADAKRFGFRKRAHLAIFCGDFAIANVHHPGVGVSSAAALGRLDGPTGPVLHHGRRRAERRAKRATGARKWRDADKLMASNFKDAPARKQLLAADARKRVPVVLRRGFGRFLPGNCLRTLCPAGRSTGEPRESKLLNEAICVISGSWGCFEETFATPTAVPGQCSTGFAGRHRHRISGLHRSAGRFLLPEKSGTRAGGPQGSDACRYRLAAGRNDSRRDSPKIARSRLIGGTGWNCRRLLPQGSAYPGCRDGRHRRKWQPERSSHCRERQHRRMVCNPHSISSLHLPVKTSLPRRRPYPLTYGFQTRLAIFGSASI